MGYTKHMKFNRFLNQYEQTSTSLTAGLAPVSDPNHQTDQTFTRRQTIDRNRKVVRRYVESDIVQDTNVDARRSIVSARREREARRRMTAQVDGQTAVPSRYAQHRPASPAATPGRPMPSAPPAQHRFVEPPSRYHPS